MSKIVDGVEYLTYTEAASAYGYSRSSIQSMVSRDIFKNAKFPHDSKAYVSRDEVEAYKNRKNRTDNEVSPSADERGVPEVVPFSLELIKAETERDRVAAVHKAIDFLNCLLHPAEQSQISTLTR